MLSFHLSQRANAFQCGAAAFASDSYHEFHQFVRVEEQLQLKSSRVYYKQHKSLL